MTAQQSETAPRAANRVLLPVPGLDVLSIWQVGPVTFHPAADARVLAEAIVHEHGRPDIPALRTMLHDRISALCESAVAEVSVAGANDGEAMATAAELTGTAVAIMRAVQHIRHRMNGMEHQAFGLPGEVPSTVTTYVVKGEMLTVGASKSRALAGFTLSDEDHQAWMADPVFRFLDQALSRPEPDRTMLQGRALLAVSLLSQIWVSYKPDVGLLNAAMALEVLLGEEDDKEKKTRIARRASYFSCGWPGQAYPGTGRAACPLLSLPLRSEQHRRGAPGPELQGILDEMREGRRIPCTRFVQVRGIYSARNKIVHEGRLPAGWAHPDTWFIAALLLGPVLAWFASHPDSNLSELDAEIAALPAPPAASR